MQKTDPVVGNNANVGYTPSNAGTQKYIEGMQYAAQREKERYGYDNDYYKAKNDALTSHYNSTTTADKKGIAYGIPEKTETKEDNSDSGTKKTTVTFGSGSYRPVASAPVETPVTPAEPDTSIEDAYTARMNAANERLKQAYEFQQAQLQRAKDDAFREAYIKQQMVERGYPEQLAAAGIRGGAAQGLIARNNADYAKQRTGVYNNYLNNLATAGQTYQQGLMQNNEDFLASMAAYQQALKQMELQHEYNKELAMLKASLG
jgi:hypothetical protein